MHKFQPSTERVLLMIDHRIEAQGVQVRYSKRLIEFVQGVEGYVLGLLGSVSTVAVMSGTRKGSGTEMCLIRLANGESTIDR